MPGKIRLLFIFLEVVPKLGIANVLYVFYYRMRLKSGSLLRRFPVQNLQLPEAVFSECARREDFPDHWKTELLKQADAITGGRIPYYSFHWMAQAAPPSWFLNPFNGKECQDTGRHWTRIPDFDPAQGDIKNVWEASRFTWVGILARAYAVSGKTNYLDTLNGWVSDWITMNPLNQGPNWKCGQESSYRVFALLNAALILDQADGPSLSLVTVISRHLQRISSNFRYARALRNNHASSEAAALFVGGNWLLSVGAPDPARNRRYAQKGRKALQALVDSLTYRDGSFSQHSVVYHRLFLDTLILSLVWTETLDLPGFSAHYHKRVLKVMHWLLAMCDESGSCPNLGSNDGTMLQSNHSCDYRDFRPSLQLASVCLEDRRVFQEGPHDEALYWFGKYRSGKAAGAYKKSSRVFESGYVVMNGGDSWALLRFPNYRFRPSHNDAFHFDLWAHGSNLLFDAGSYSYNPDKESRIPDLKSVHSHNTLSFDGREQMPRLGRFLLGRWLKPLSVGQLNEEAWDSGNWEGSYKDAAGNTHWRKVVWKGKHWELMDRFSGAAAAVEIGFNFDQCKYELNEKDHTLSLPWGKMLFSENTALSVRPGWVSLYYNQSKEVLRIVASSKNNSEVRTSIYLHR